MNQQGSEKGIKTVYHIIHYIVDKKNPKISVLIQSKSTFLLLLFLLCSVKGPKGMFQAMFLLGSPLREFLSLLDTG